MYCGGETQNLNLETSKRNPGAILSRGMVYLRNNIGNDSGFQVLGFGGLGFRVTSSESYSVEGFGFSGPCGDAACR